MGLELGPSRVYHFRQDITLDNITLDNIYCSGKWTLTGPKIPLMTCNSGLYTSDKKWIKMKMKTFVHLNSKGNEVVAWCSFSVGSCLFLSSHHHYMCCCCWCVLHHICVNQINNENVHQNAKASFGNKNIHLSSGVVREKVGNLFLNMCSTFQSNSYNGISKMCHGLLYAHSHKGTKANGYLDCQWYDHINTMKGGQL